MKLPGQSKFSAHEAPYPDTAPYFQARLAAFGPGRCLWGSDWPHLRAPARIGYGPLIALSRPLLPDPADRHPVLRKTPRRLLGFD